MHKPQVGARTSHRMWENRLRAPCCIIKFRRAAGSGSTQRVHKGFVANLDLAITTKRLQLQPQQQFRL
ncbi:hypothetical protein BKG67_04910 [Mycobacteroides chelonae]|nr:hypothetical protein BKG66_07855 [Mycobacteroides chelonae]OHT75945.1 hypothetical protein BKG67_04910 [Mycobacteroides chelonae]